MQITRREFNKVGCRIIIGAAAGNTIIDNIVSTAAENPQNDGYDWNQHLWGYVIDTGKCIGCGRCANACKLENDVPFDEPVYRTWVERYRNSERR